MTTLVFYTLPNAAKARKVCRGWGRVKGASGEWGPIPVNAVSLQSSQTARHRDLARPAWIHDRRSAFAVARRGHRSTPVGVRTPLIHLHTSTELTGTHNSHAAQNKKRTLPMHPKRPMFNRFPKKFVHLVHLKRRSKTAPISGCASNGGSALRAAADALPRMDGCDSCIQIFT